MTENKKKKKYITKYLHTINSEPASYVSGQQICYLSKYGKRNLLADSLEQIRDEQRKSNEWRTAQGFDLFHDYDYTLVHIEIPEEENV